MPEEKGAGKRDKARCVCESCKRDRREPHKIARGVIHSYQSMPPGGWRPRITAKEARKHGVNANRGVVVLPESPRAAERRISMEVERLPEVRALRNRIGRHARQQPSVNSEGTYEWRRRSDGAPVTDAFVNGLHWQLIDRDYRSIYVANADAQARYDEWHRVRSALTAEHSQLVSRHQQRLMDEWIRNNQAAQRRDAVPPPGKPLYYLGVELETTVTGDRIASDPEVRRLRRELDRNSVALYDTQGVPNDATARDAWRARYTELTTALVAASNRAEAARQTIMTAAEAASVRYPRGLWHPKHDGSVSGPEFASQPATLDWWRKHKAALEAMFTTLLHGGVRSHEGDEAGMHVNISTNAFDSNEGHLFRFARLIHGNKTWARRMSQRTDYSMSHWAPATMGISDCREWGRAIAREGYANWDRYTATNAGNDGRIEFRLPRGTLRIDRFFKNLEWTVAMIEFSREVTDVELMTPVQFTKYAHDHKREYPYLWSFIQEKFTANAKAAEAMPDRPIERIASEPSTPPDVIPSLNLTTSASGASLSRDGYYGRSVEVPTRETLRRWIETIGSVSTPPSYPRTDEQGA